MIIRAPAFRPGRFSLTKEHTMRRAIFFRPWNAREGDRVAESVGEVKLQAPWASQIIELEGGFIAFESEDDCNRWYGRK